MKRYSKVNPSGLISYTCLCHLFIGFITVLASSQSYAGQAPQLVTPLQNQNATEGILYTNTNIAASFTDPEGQPLIFSAIGLENTGLSIDQNSGNISGITSDAAAKLSPLTITIIAEDDEQQTVTDDFQLVVTDVNNPPKLIFDLDDFLARENIPLTPILLSEFFSDPDSLDILTFSLLGLPTMSGLGFNPINGEISGIPNQADSMSSPLELTVTVDDQNGGQLSQPFNLIINDSNTAPQSVPIPDQNATQNIAFSLDISPFFSDQDQDILTYALTGTVNFTGLHINRTTGVISGAPNNLDAIVTQGQTLTVTASDPFAAKAIESFQLTVANINDAPIIFDKNFVIDENTNNGIIVGQLNAFDPDNDVLTLTLVEQMPVNAFTINGAQQLVINQSSQLDFEQNPIFRLNVKAEDPEGLSDNAIITINLNNLNDNIPTSQNLSFTVMEHSANGTVIGSVSAQDNDGNQTLMFSISAGNTDNIFALNSATGQLSVNDSLKLDFEQQQQFMLTVSISDGVNNINQTTTIKVINRKDLSASAVFQASDPLRDYLDINGVWNGVMEVTSTTGDTIHFSLANDSENSAFDINLTSTLPSSINTLLNTGTVFLSDPSCGDIQSVLINRSGVNQSYQFFDSLNQMVLPDLAPGCSIRLSFGISTNNTASDGTLQIRTDLSFSDTDGGAQNNNSFNEINILVKAGALVITKELETGPEGQFGDTETFLISITNTGLGGLFDVEFVDQLGTGLTPSNNLNFLVEQTRPQGTPPGVPFTDNLGREGLRFAYLASGGTIEILANSEVANCDNVDNTVFASERNGLTSQGLDSIIFNPPATSIQFRSGAGGANGAGLPDIMVDFGATQTVIINLVNDGQSVAQNLSIDSNLELLPDLNINLPQGSPFTYDTNTGLFTYQNGPLNPGQNIDLVFDLDVSGCPANLTSANLVFTPNYLNACSEPISRPTDTTSLVVLNSPNLTVEKSGSKNRYFLGETGQWVISLTSDQPTNLPAAGPVGDLNDEITLTDQIPNFIAQASIQTIPANTQLFIDRGTIGSFTPVTVLPITDIQGGDTIQLKADNEDILSGNLDLVIDFQLLPPLDCVTGIPVVNTAQVSYQSCNLMDSDFHEFIVNSPTDPMGQTMGQEIAATQDFIIINADQSPFETGLASTDAVINNEPGEGEAIQYQATYAISQGTGTWSGSRFIIHLGNGPDEPLPNQSEALISNSISIVDVATNNQFTPDTNDISVLANGRIEVKLDSIQDRLFGNNNAIHGDLGDDDTTFGKHIHIRFSATISNVDLDPNRQGRFIERVTLIINNSNLGCANDGVLTQGIFVNIHRAELSPSFVVKNTIEVCEIFPLSLKLDGPSANARSDNILMEFDYSFFKLVNDANLDGVPDDLQFNGNLATNSFIAQQSVANQILSSPPENTLQIKLQPETNTYIISEQTATATFNVQLPPSAIANTAPGNATQLQLGLVYDDWQNTAQLTPTPQRGPEIAIFTPAILTPNLNLRVSPQNRFIDQREVDWQITISNNGSGTAYNVVVTDTLPDALDGNALLSIPVPNSVNNTTLPHTMTWIIPMIPPGGQEIIQLTANLNQNSCDLTQVNGVGGIGNQINATSGCLGEIGFSADIFDPAFLDPGQGLQIVHDATKTQANLCQDTDVSIIARNTGLSRLYDVTLVEDLSGTVLSYIPGSTTFSINGIFQGVAADPVLSGVDNKILTWQGDANSPDPLLKALAEMPTVFEPSLGDTIVINIQLDSLGEQIANSNTLLSLRGSFLSACGASSLVSSGALFQLPINQPIMSINKRGWNISAGQTVVDANDNLFAGVGDVLAFKVDIENNGSVEAEDVVIQDMLPNNFSITDFATQADFSDASTNFLMAPFINLPNDKSFSAINIPAFSSTTYYVRGTVVNEGCADIDNTALIEWGCVGEGLPGGISFPEDNDDTSDISLSAAPELTQVVTNGANSGTLDTKGIVTITISNSGASARNLVIEDVLPQGYAIDPSFTPTLNTSNTTQGHIDGFQLVGGLPYTGTGLANDPLIFNLIDSGGALLDTDPQNNILRNGETLSIVFKIVQNANFDLAEDQDIRLETQANTLDPAPIVSSNNQVTLNYENTCGSSASINDSVVIDPLQPDLDIDILEPIQRIINSSGPLPFSYTIVVTNNGDAPANNGVVLVSLGGGWDGSMIPAGCGPAPIDGGFNPGSANGSQFICSVSNLPPGSQLDFSFPDLIVNNETESLKIRAQVTGDILLADNTDSGNDYSLDTIRAHIIGFRLNKTLTNTSQDNNTDSNVFIGEDVEYAISATWFGSDEPINNVSIVDQLPGNVAQTLPIMGYVSDIVNTTPGNVGLIGNGNTSQIKPPPVSFGTDGLIEWQINDFVSGSFQADLTSRVLNTDNNNTGPNIEGADLANTINGQFQYHGMTFDNTSLGYPPLSQRQVTTTIRTPDVTIDIRVCNETALGAQAPCDSDTEFLEMAVGDANDRFIYRMRLINNNSLAPAFDLDINTAIDNNLTLIPFNTDGLDNDQDGQIDEALEGDGQATNVQFTQALTNQERFAKLEATGPLDLFFATTGTLNVTPQEVIQTLSILLFDTLENNNGGNAQTDGARTFSVNDNVSITINSPMLDKQLMTTSFNNDTLLELIIGEQATFSLSIELPEGTIENFQIQDLLPNGFDLIIADNTDVNIGANIACDNEPPIITPTSLPNSGSPLTLSYNFGRCIVNSANALGNTISISYTVQLADRGSNIDGAIISNQAFFSFTDNNNQPVNSVVSVVDLDIKEPKLDINKKSLDIDGLVTGADAVDFIIESCNVGRADAYNISIQDELPIGMRLTAISNIQTGIFDAPHPAGNLQSSVNPDPTGTDAPQGFYFWSLNDSDALLPGQCLRISYQATVDNNILPNIELLNVATVTAYFSQPSSLPNERRRYPIIGPATSTVTSVGLQWRPNQQSTVSAGTNVVYAHELEIVNGQGIGELSFIIDSTQNLNWSIYQDSNNNGQLDANDTLWTNGDAPNFEQQTFFATAFIPSDTPAGFVDSTTIRANYRVAGTDFSNVVTDVTRVNEVEAGALVANKSVALDRNCNGDLADELVSDQLFEPFKNIAPGQCARYRISFNNPSFSNLSDINVYDQTPTFTTYIGGSAQILVIPPNLSNAQVVQQPLDGEAGSLHWSFDGVLLPGSQGTVQYDVRIVENEP